MDLHRVHFRAMIFYDFSSGLSEIECLERLHGDFRGKAPSRATVFRWFAEFKRGRETLKDEGRSGRPANAVCPKTIASVKKLVTEDRRITYREIEATLGITSPSINQILHDELAVKKISSRWVPHLLTAEQKITRVQWCQEMILKFANGTSRRIFDIVTGDETWIYQYDPETKRQSTVWVFSGEDRPTKVKRSRSVGKKMAATFFSVSGHVATIPLESQKFVNAEWYCTVCLPEVFQVLKDRRPRTGLRGLLLHHDNAPAHQANATQQFLQQESMQLLSHPPYSPDLAPCDFFLFPKVKEKLRGQRFDCSQTAFDAYIEEV